jgi:arylsulfatase A-like enzyme
MRLRHFISATLIACMIVQTARVIAQRATPQAQRQPNVVLIIMDDLGYGDIGSYGVKDARTPNLDRLAREGVRFTNAYSNGANCSPTRAALISGRYQQRVGIEWPLNTTNDLDRGLPVTGVSLPALLKGKGYATGLVGKWHLGFKPEYGPNAHGFDEFFGLLGGAVDFYTHRRGDGMPDLFDNTTPVEAPGYLTDEITRKAVSFVDRRAAGPFFLEVAYNAVHWPFQPPGRAPSDRDAAPRPAEKGDLRLYQGPDDPTPATRQDYVRMLESADEGVGRILAALDRHGLSRNNLVAFTSDNGGEWLSRNAPLSHRKSTLWEGGIRVPLLLRWPARLPARKTSEQVAITMDLTATILAAAGVGAPPGHRPEGIDLLPILRGESALADRQLFWRIARPNRQQRAVRSGQWKLLVDGGQFLLFDLSADPGEKHDLTAQRPDLVVKLKTLLEAWEKDVDQKPQANQ